LGKSPAKILGGTPEKISEHPEKPTESWVCNKCKQNNRPEQLKCVCGNPWVSQEFLKESEFSKKREEDQKKAAIEKWICEKCHVVMDPSLENCASCGEKNKNLAQNSSEDTPMKKSRSASVVAGKSKKKVVSQKDGKGITKNNM